jgi:hypothetical protein
MKNFFVYESGGMVFAYVRGEFIGCVSRGAKKEIDDLRNLVLALQTN